MKARLVTASVICAGIILAACSNDRGGPLEASGTIAAREVNLSMELAGKVAEVFVDESARVSEGDLLLRLDDELLNAQLSGAEAAVETAEIALRAAVATQERTQIQFAQTAAKTDTSLTAQRLDRWVTSGSDEIDLPEWYFMDTALQPELWSAAETEAKTACAAWVDERLAYDAILKQLGGETLQRAEQSLVEKQAGFEVAKDIVDQANKAVDGSELREAATDYYDIAKDELTAAEEVWHDLLTDSEEDDLLQKRAELNVALARCQTAYDRVRDLQVSYQSYDYQIAEVAVQEAQIRADQAQSAIKQAKANLELLQVQKRKLDLYAPISGIVLSRGVEAGESIVPGSILLVLGDLSTVQLTVYIPEDRYGGIEIGQSVNVTVDSFPDQVFTGKVLQIADQAEFTPRNVQTTDGRKTTVFAVEIEIENKELQLKPGMPADVAFQP